MGRFDEAIAEIKRAQELDPLYLMSQTMEGIILYSGRRYDQAIAQLNKSIEMEPNFFAPYCWLGLAYIEKGMFEAASTATQKCITLSGGFTGAVAVQGHIYAKSGKRSEAQKILDQFMQLSQRRYVPPSLLLFIYIGLGEKDKAFEWLEKAYEAHDPFLIYSKMAPSFDSLRSDSRFSAFLKKIGLEN